MKILSQKIPTVSMQTSWGKGKRNSTKGSFREGAVAEQLREQAKTKLLPSRTSRATSLKDGGKTWVQVHPPTKEF